TAGGGPRRKPIPFHMGLYGFNSAGSCVVAASAACRHTQAAGSGFRQRAPDMVCGRRQRRGRQAIGPRRILVTGGSGFPGSALVRALVRQGEAVRVFDDNSRGALRRLREVERDIEFVNGDIRDPAAVDGAMRGIEGVHHLAFVNGTGTFYSAPDLVLDGVDIGFASALPMRYFPSD